MNHPNHQASSLHSSPSSSIITARGVNRMHQGIYAKIDVFVVNNCASVSGVRGNVCSSILVKGKRLNTRKKTFFSSKRINFPSIFFLFNAAVRKLVFSAKIIFIITIKRKKKVMISSSGKTNFDRWLTLIAMKFQGSQGGRQSTLVSIRRIIDRKWLITGNAQKKGKAPENWFLPFKKEKEGEREKELFHPQFR